MTEQIAYAVRHQALSQYIAELQAKHLADRSNRAIVREALAARAALLQLEREAG
jgi:hypothetical protein